MSQAQNYREFDALPEGWISYQPKDGEEAPQAIKWSGDTPPPPIGSRIVLTINSIGPAIVRGYFVEYGWLGVLTEVLDPPAWWIEQNCEKGKPWPMGHAFGTEIKEAA